MPHSELMPIGLFARRTGLTPSALRFYADSGLLPPAEVDPVSGYRYYGADQAARATSLRQLREIAMPLTAVQAVLGAEPAEASRLIDEHVAKVLRDAAAVRRKAASVKASLASLTGVPGPPVAALKGPVLKGPVLADAIEQVLTATACEPGMPVLGALRVEATREAVTLTATDRYRLSTRTLVPAEAAATAWAVTVDGDGLRAAVADIRRSALVRVEATPHGFWLRIADREDRHCRLLSEEFPDHRLMLAALPEVTSRVTVSKELFLRALAEHPDERITLRMTPHGPHGLNEPHGPHGPHGLNVLTRDEEHPGVPLTATVTGRDLRISFELTTLYPAVSTAIGPDVMLDLRGADEPVTFRSADRGDLTTLAMPVKPDRSG
ncbi:DNA polymerase III subunit beta family protein [Streptomyces johnsoniae]|uniref:MerR family transcriptional regulator n=1 Tax=Streptomyces johnsoniae TaxID=3075532 RepID=A0ABU2S8Z0_9ACTN|nr:MerR family transcriptional regulator [Streptomyces sp. DSM 41886]MDT0445446.1 MerR family transcriptional regulator [Streptomyces sp. DSM 41886]